MKQTTKVALAALLQAAGSLIGAFAGELSGTAEPEAAAAPEPPKPAKAPKEKKADKPAEKAPEAEAPAEEPKPEMSKEEKDAIVKKLRAIIEPAVHAAQGDEVKKLINKYVGKEDSKLPELAEMPDKHAAFEKDIKALTY